MTLRLLHFKTVAFGLCCVFLCRAVQVQGQVVCDEALNTAQTLFLVDLDFSGAAELLEGCLDQEAFADEEIQQAYKLLVQIYDAGGLEQRVQETLTRLLERAPDYTPAPDDPDSFISLVEAFKQTWVPPQPPVASFTADPAQGEAPLTVQFDASASSDPDGTLTAYAWDFGDSATGTGAVASHTYEQAGAYTVTLSVTDDNGTTAMVTETITATVPTPAPNPVPAVAVVLAATHGEEIRNARLSQEADGRLALSYDLGGGAKAYEVTLLLSTDGGQSFAPLPRQVTGDVGKGVPPGSGKQLVWTVLEDFPRGLAGDQYRVRLDAQPQRNSSLLYIVGGALVAGAGASVALLAGGGGDDPGGGGNGNPGGTGIPTPPGRPGGN